MKFPGILNTNIRRLLGKRVANKSALLAPPNVASVIAAPLPHQDDLLSHLRQDAIATVFDIGAWNGIDSIRYSHLFPNATVYAFEPLPENVAQANANIHAFGNNRINLVDRALSDAEGTATFHVSGGHPPQYKNSTEWRFGAMSSSLLPPDQTEISRQWSWLKFNETITVNTITLIAFCAAHQVKDISLIHLDVQGAELKVLSGAGSLIQNIKAIWLEVSSKQFYENQPIADELYRFLSESGFKRVFSHGSEPQWDELWVRQSP